MNCIGCLFISGHHKDVLARLRVGSLPICAISFGNQGLPPACSAAETSMRSFLYTIASLNDSSHLTLQWGKISTGTFRLYNVQQIDLWWIINCKSVSCSVASEISAKWLVISFDLRETVWPFKSLVPSCFGCV